MKCFLFSRGSFPFESSQWKICALVIEDIEEEDIEEEDIDEEDNEEEEEEIVKRNLMTLALCGLVSFFLIITTMLENLSAKQ